MKNQPFDFFRGFFLLPPQKLDGNLERVPSSRGKKKKKLAKAVARGRVNSLTCGAPSWQILSRVFAAANRSAPELKSTAALSRGAFASLALKRKKNKISLGHRRFDQNFARGERRINTTTAER